jgi:hypothetical protein
MVSLRHVHCSYRTERRSTHGRPWPSDLFAGGSMPQPVAESSYWVEPSTHMVYPMSYQAYRRTREAQEKPPPRHCTLGAEIDRHVWRQWQRPAVSEVDVILAFRQGAPPRVQRLVGEVLRAIRRGRPAGEAIRRAARRFGLRQTCARAFITAGITVERRPREDTMPLAKAGSRA